MLVYFGTRAEYVDYKWTRVCIRQNLNDAISTATCPRLYIEVAVFCSYKLKWPLY